MTKRTASQSSRGQSSQPFRWSFPRWVIAQALSGASDGMVSRELWQQTDGQCAHPRAALDALVKAGFITLTCRSTRCFHAAITECGRAALEEEMRQRGNTPITRGPIQPPRDSHGRPVISYAFEPVATHPPGELWRRVTALMAHIRSRMDRTIRPDDESALDLQRLSAVARADGLVRG